MFNVIPSATLTTPIALPSYSTLAETAAPPSESQLTLAAANAPLRYGYGQMRLAPLIANALDTAAGELILDCVIGQGPVGGLIATKINGENPPAGVTVTFYDGTQTTTDATLVAAWAAKGVVYTDVRPGVAYAVVKISGGVDLQLDPRSITFEVQQLKVYDPRGFGIELDGVDDWIECNSTSSLNMGTGSFTVLITARHDDFTNPKSLIPMGKQGSPWNGAAGWGIGAGYSATALYVFIHDGTTFANGYIAIDDGYRPAQLAGQMVDYAIFFDRAGAKTVRLAINGVLQTGSLDISSVTGSVNNANKFNIGLSVGWKLDGFVDQFIMVGALLTLDQANAWRAVRLKGDEPNLSCYWRLDEGTGTAVGDTSPNAIAATLLNGPTWGKGTGRGPVSAAAKTPYAAFSTNPALHAADFLSSATRGPGDTLDWASVATVADRCDELLGGKKRMTSAIAFAEQRPKKDIEDTLRAAAGCFVVREGPTTYLVADAPVDLTSALSFPAADWRPETLRYTQREAARAPNRISVRYTNTATEPWSEAYSDPVESADVTAGLVDAVEMVVNAPWITDHAEAVRLRHRYASEHSLGLRTLEFETFELGWKVRRGDVVKLTNGVDLVSKPVRIQSMVALGFSRLKFTAQEYDPAMYSSDTPATPTWPTTTLPNPRTVLPVAALSMAEEVYLDQSQAATVATGAKYLSRFRCTWTASADRYLMDTIVRFKIGTTTIFEGPTTQPLYVSPPVQQGQSYTIEVVARNVLGILSAVVSASAVAQGKLLVPGDVPRIGQAIELGGEVLLAWDPAVDIDVIRYEWRYTPNTTGSTWAAATFIDRVDSLRARFKGLPVGTHRFYVKAIDSVGNQSTNAAYVDIAVTSDANAFLQALEYISPTLTNMIAYLVEGEAWQRWISNRVGSWDSLFTSAMSTYTNPIATYGTGDSTWIGETIDIGTLITGNWSLDLQLTDLSGTASKYIQTSPDGSVWTDQTGLSYTGAARYVRPKVTSTGAFTITRPPKINLSAVTRKESGGPVTSNSGSAKTISLAGKYVKAVRITVTPTGTVARMPTVDNVVLSLSGANSFDVYLFDAAGTQVASDFRWDWEGY